MSWYDEKQDGPSKRYIEWAFGEEVDPIPDEPGFYRAKQKGNCEQRPSTKICPRENGLTGKGQIPRDPDACISCLFSVWDREEAEG